MRFYWRLIFLMLVSLKSMGQKVFQLAPPFLKFSSVFFDKSQVVQIKFEQPGTQIRFTLDGSEPNEQSKLYTQPVIITTHNQQIKARVFSKNYQASETVSARFVKKGLPIISCTSSAPSSKYPGNSKGILFDNKGGSNSFNDGSWIGFDNDTLSFRIELDRKQKISSVLMDIMDSQGSWIFLPQNIRISSVQDGMLTPIDLENEYVADNTEHKANGPQLMIFNLRKPVETKNLLVQMEVVRKMPEWHAAKGEHAWLFIDEIKVY